MSAQASDVMRLAALALSEPASDLRLGEGPRGTVVTGRYDFRRGATLDALRDALVTELRPRADRDPEVARTLIDAGVTL